MPSKPTTRELIDACRADHDDPQRSELPELAPLAREVGQNATVATAYKQSQHFDRQVRAALEDVPIPAGLAEQMLAGCEAALVAPAQKPEPKPSVRKPISRRNLVLSGLAAVAGVGLIVLGLIGNPVRSTPVSPDELAQSVLQWEQQVISNAPHWKQPPTKAMLAAYPLDRSIAVSPARGIALPAGVVAYELKFQPNGEGAKRAMLFVQPNKRPHSIRNFPFTRLPASGAVTMSAWQRDGYVYVLFITDESSPNAFIRRVPLT